MCVRFSGQPDEVGFIMLHVDINQHSPDLVGSVMQTLEAVAHNDIQKAEHGLDWNMRTMVEMNNRRREMWKASRWQHYNDFRVFIMGVKGNEELFGDGVTYTGVWDEPKQFRGQTGAQDDIIPMEDIFSGVINYYPKNELTKYLLDLRTYRPKCIQQFFIDLENEVGGIHERGLFGYLKDQKSVVGLSRLLGILEQIYHFRNGHWQFVQKYIMANTPYAKATGGTPITSWLPNQLKAVMQQMQDVLDSIASLQVEMDDATSSIVSSNQTTLPHKQKLLEEQLAMVAGEQFSAEKVFDLNEKFGLKDQ
jgi:indoleamine 2,3-dioxygenase